MRWSKPHPRVPVPVAAFASERQHQHRGIGDSLAHKATAICSLDFKKSFPAPEVALGAGNSEVWWPEFTYVNM